MNDPAWPDILPLKNAIGWTVVHSLWQLTLVALLLYLVLRILPQKKTELRYILLLIGLIAGVSWVGVTFLQEWKSQVMITQSVPLENLNPAVPAKGLPAATELTPSLWDQFMDIPQRLNAYIPGITFAWLSGMSLFCLYLLFGLAYLKYLEYYRVSLPGEHWQLRVHELSRQMGVKRQVRLFISEAVDEPITFQLFRPVIMVPVFFFTGLTPAQIEALLLHELAHIRRHDFAVNLLQSLVEILFFFHPAVWWLSGRIREEREYCCDNAVLAIRKDPFPYVEALTQIQSTQFSYKNRLAMSANGKNSMLSRRVFRLLGRYDREPSRFKSLVFALLLLMVSLSTQAFLIHEKPVVRLASLPVFELVNDAPASAQPMIAIEEAEAQNELNTAAIPVPASPVLQPAQPMAQDSLPLYVIDGEKKEGDFEIKELNPSQIAAISVLKGPKAIEKYGQAGQYGVIEITTKGQASDLEPNAVQTAPATRPENNSTIRIRARADRAETIVQGTVTDENSKPLIGTNVLIKGTTVGTITDFNGAFTIRLPKDCATLIFSYIGKKTTELKNICAGEEAIVVELNDEAGAPAERPEKIVRKKELNEPLITGRILNEDQQPVAGANILIKGKTIGTVSDMQGNFRLQLPSTACETLVISYIGLKRAFIEDLCDDQDLNVILEKEVVSAPGPVVKPDPQITIEAKPAFSDFSVFPNPAKGAVNVSFQLEEAAQVKLSAYTTDGKLIKTIVDQSLTAGAQRFLWSAGEENRGTFIILLDIDGKEFSRRQVVIK